MTTIGQRIGSPYSYSLRGRDHLGLELNIGIEWEVEGWRNNRNFGQLLTQVPDGTLRNNGREILFAAPYAEATAESAIKDFYANIDFPSLNCSPLCSTHLHLDMRWANNKQAAACAILLANSDRELYAVTNSSEREDNIYALTAYNNPGFWTQAERLFHGKSIRTRVLSNRRYSSINLVPLQGDRAKGTIEIRHSNVIQSADLLYKYINMAFGIIAPVFNTRDTGYTLNDLLKELSRQKTPVTENIKEIIRRTL